MSQTDTMLRIQLDEEDLMNDEFDRMVQKPGRIDHTRPVHNDHTFFK